MGKKIFFGILLIAVIAGIFYLTLQTPDQTTALSNSLRDLLLRFGFQTDSHTLRSDIHLVEYFILGVSLGLFFRAMRWKPWWAVFIGCVIGLLDEGLKYYLPTREFDAVDLGKDYIGVLIAIVLIILLGLIPRREKKQPDEQ